MRTLILLFSFMCGPALAQEAEAPEPSAELVEPSTKKDKKPKKEVIPAWQQEKWGGFGMPAVNYNTDEGFGLGAVANLYRYNGSTQPYKYKFGLQVFFTTRGVHAHHFDFDALELAGGKLRIFTRVRFEASKSEVYCGLGGGVTCDPKEAEGAADDLGLAGDARDDFVRRYFLMRYMQPRLFFFGRYEFTDQPGKVDLLFGLRANYLIPGDFTEANPWPGSKYDNDYAEAEQGSMVVGQLGIGFDSRDYEPAPSRGWWLEASVRGGGSFDQDWAYFGFNTTLRGYAPLAGDTLVLANRFVFDGIVGDVSSREMVIPGSFSIYTLFGGANFGRGIRLRQFKGRAVAANQLELRWRMFRVPIGSASFGMGLVLFSDVGMTGLNWSDFGDTRPAFGQGLGLRFEVDGSFVLRADVGFSDEKNWSPGVYIEVDNVF